MFLSKTASLSMALLQVQSEKGPSKDGLSTLRMRWKTSYKNTIFHHIFDVCSVVGKESHVSFGCLAHFRKIGCSSLGGKMAVCHAICLPRAALSSTFHL